MKIGDKVTMVPETLLEESSDGKRYKRPMKGMVVYVHPKGRYYTVAFDTRGGPIRESFKFT